MPSTARQYAIDRGRRADVVIDQLTWLPANPADIIKSIPNNTRLHEEGGDNLLAAAQQLGVAPYICNRAASFSTLRRGGSRTR